MFDALRDLGIRRRTDDKVIAGVCSGLAIRLGVDPVVTRVAFVLLSILGGAGVTIYLVAWALLPNDRNELPLERAVRHGDGGSLVLVVIAALSLFEGSWWGFPWGVGGGWRFPWGLVLTGLFIWWLYQRSLDRPHADQRVSNQQPGPPPAARPPSAEPGPAASVPGGSPTPSPYLAVSKPRRRSGGPLMALIAFGLALVTYGSLIWMGSELDWTGSHQAIAMAGSLIAMGLLLVGLGLAGWRAGFVSFLAVLLAITAWSSSIVPTGIHFGGGIGDQTWAPTTVTSDTNYDLGAGGGVLDLSLLPTEGLSEARIPAYVGIGDLKVIVPADLTVRVVGHVGLGEILQPGENDGQGKGGADVSRSFAVGDGPTEVVVDAGVGIGQITVVKE